jgi:hypothetical protein
MRSNIIDRIRLTRFIDEQGSCGCVFWNGGMACKGDHPGCAG